MLPLESNTYIFIVKIWSEEVIDSENETLWRGEVKHVPSGKRHYFGSTEQFLAILQTYLKDIGIEI